MWERCKPLPTLSLGEDRLYSFLRPLSLLYAWLNSFFFFRHGRFCLCFSYRVSSHRSFQERESKLQLYVASIFSSSLIPCRFILRQRVLYARNHLDSSIDINEFLIFEDSAFSFREYVSSSLRYWISNSLYR